MGLDFRVTLARASGPSVLLLFGIATVSAGTPVVASGGQLAKKVAAESGVRSAEPEALERVTDERALQKRSNRAPVPDPELPAPAPPPAAPAVITAPAPLLPAPSVHAAGAILGSSNQFSYGYCTWWVANKRPIPWTGNAIDWWPNARLSGFPEGQQPRVGAIMVMGFGGGASPQGHAAYVESLNPDGSFVVSEMNWGQWAVVDLRTITSMQGILGFIY